MVNVVITASQCVQVTPCDTLGADTGIPVIVPGDAIQDITAVVMKPQNFDYQPWTQFGNPVTPGTGMPDYIPFQEFYVIRMVLKSSGKVMDIKIADWFNSGQTDDLTGATALIGILQSAIPLGN